MTKLEELIKALCPNGVDYFFLGDIGKFYGGLTGKSKDDFKDGNAKFITYKNVYSNPALDINPTETVKILPNENQRTLEYGDIIFTGSSETPDECGFSSVVTQIPNQKLYLNSFCFIYRLNDKSIILPDFSKHLFRSENLRYQIGKTASGVTRFNVSKDKMARVKIPVPPLPVQEEIVRILDSFTKLTAELTAELTARKKQYEYYRVELLTFGENIETSLLQECCVLSRGEYITKKDAIPGNIPVILGGQEPAYFINKHNHIGKAIVISRSGASAGFVSYWDEPIFVTDGFIVEGTSYVNTRFLYFFLKNKQKLLNGMKKGGGVPHITGKNIGEMLIPVIPMQEQERIVSILDRFDALCNDLTSGLPAEIEDRQKQYEYYRNKLLTF